MTACPVWQTENKHDNKDREDHRGNWTTECKPAMVEGFVEEIANGGAKRSSEDKRGPEQQDPRHTRPEIGRSKHRQSGEYERPARVAEARIGYPIPESSS